MPFWSLFVVCQYKNKFVVRQKASSEIGMRERGGGGGVAGVKVSFFLARQKCRRLKCGFVALLFSFFFFSFFLYKTRKERGGNKNKNRRKTKLFYQNVLFVCPEYLPSFKTFFRRSKFTLLFSLDSEKHSVSTKCATQSNHGKI